MHILVINIPHVFYFFFYIFFITNTLAIFLTFTIMIITINMIKMMITPPPSDKPCNDPKRRRQMTERPIGEGVKGDWEGDWEGEGEGEKRGGGAEGVGSEAMAALAGTKVNDPPSTSPTPSPTPSLSKKKKKKEKSGHVL